MGALKHFDVDGIRKAFGLKVFFETGLGAGVGLEHAASFPFESLVSIEIEPEIIKRFGPKFKDDSRILILNNNSADALREYCVESPYGDNPAPTLFFLDAHFPGADLGYKTYDAEKDEKLRLPLMTELGIIRDLRAKRGFKDVILIDDFMLYDDDHEYQFSHAKQTMKILPREDRNKWKEILTLLDDTHQTDVTREETGYVAFLPRL